MGWTQILGQSGERAGLDFLKTKGYRILATNFRTKLGELDVVAEKDNTVVFVEIKARHTLTAGTPAASVTSWKQTRVIKTALQFLKKHRLWGQPIRFDVLSLGPQGLEHIENAFEAKTSFYR